MTETFCGKDCDLCQEKLSEECRGCKEGPGRRFGGNCPIADCCREKYHANCDTCQEAVSCTKRQQKDQMQQIRIAGRRQKKKKKFKKEKKQRYWENGCGFCSGSSFPISLRGLCLTKA